MPVINLQTVGKLSHEQKEQITKEFTETLQKVAGKPPEYVYVIIDEVEPENWGHKGKLFG